MFVRRSTSVFIVNRINSAKNALTYSHGNAPVMPLLSSFRPREKISLYSAFERARKVSLKKYVIFARSNTFSGLSINFGYNSVLIKLS